MAVYPYVAIMSRLVSVAVAFGVAYRLILKRGLDQLSLGPITSPLEKAGKDIDILTIDAKELQESLESGLVTSLGLVHQYLTQIEQHDERLHAMIQTSPLDLLETTAKALDKERIEGKVRSPLHGIPIIIKDNVATHPMMGLPTSAGSFALLKSKPRRNAAVVDQLISAGLIILGKANLSEFANARGSNMPSGWSAVGGQSQSAYVKSGVDPNDSKDGHTSPCGSSAGSAVGVSAGYAPLAIGTETDGSLVCPAGRAALYTIKPTIGVVPQDGIVPISSHFDSAGPMTKSSYDLAALLDVLASKDPSDSFTSHLTGSWSELSIASLDPEVWKFPDEWVKPVSGAESQMIQETRDAYHFIKSQAKNFVDHVDLVTVDAFNLDGKSCEEIVTLVDMKNNLTSYLQDLVESDVRSLADLIEYNEKHAAVELPTHHPRQDNFIKCQNHNISSEEYDRHLSHLRRVARERGVEQILKAYEVDVIIGPTDSGLTSMATAGGYPLCSMPLGYLDYNGRPFGMSAITARNRDDILIKVMSAWEKTFPQRKAPAFP